MFNLGQITIPLVSAFAGGTFILSGATAYFGSQLAFKDDVADIRVDAKANETSIVALEKRDDEIASRLDRIENKIDTLLIRNGVNPQSVK